MVDDQRKPGQITQPIRGRPITIIQKRKKKKNFFLFKLKTFDITMSTYIR